MKTFLWVSCVLGLCCALQAQPAPLNYSEPPDLPTHFGTGVYPSIGTLGLGTNTITGSVTGRPYGLIYVGDFDDSFSLTLPAGLLLTKVTLTITNYDIGGVGGGACSLDIYGVAPSGVFGMPSIATPKCLGGGDTTYTYTPPANFSTQSPGTFPVYLSSPFNPIRNTAGAFTYSLSFYTIPAPTTLSITSPAVLPAGSVNTAYSEALAAAGGTPPYTWQTISGSLPPGLSISLAGAITGTPTQAGTFPFTARVVDGALSFTNQAMSITIAQPGQNFTLGLRMPQIVDGGGWQTTFAVVNIDTQPVVYNFRFWDDNGNALALPIVNGTAGQLTGTLAPGATVFAQTPGTALGTSQGWAEVAASGQIGVTAIFQYNSNGINSQGTSNGVASSNSIFMPFDNTQGYVTGLAIANTNPSQALNVTLTFLTDMGAQVTSTITLPAHAHTTFVLPSMLPGLVNARGSLNATAATPDIALIGLRFSPTLSFTSLAAFQ